MSSRLTLLFLCDDYEVECPFIPALQAAGFRLVVPGQLEEAFFRLNQHQVDAIAVHRSDLGRNPALTSVLKAMGRKSPVLLLTGKSSAPAIKPPGVDAIFCADARDESVVRAVAVFLRCLLSRKSPNPADELLSGDRISDIQSQPRGVHVVLLGEASGKLPAAG